MAVGDRYSNNRHIELYQQRLSMAGESLIIKFYEKRATENRGCSLDDMQHYNHKQLENKHDYIQWMFPLSE
jgi:hypothetical protein